MWKNLKGLFVVEEEGKKKASSTPAAGKSSPKAAAKPAAPAPTAPSTSSAPASAPTSVDGSVNDRFVKVLMEAMEAANLPGFDYLEYKKALQNLKKMNFTDSVRFQTAYATAQSMGVTPKALLDSAQHYLQTLKKEESKFAQALKGQRAQQVSDKEAQLKQLDASIQQQEAKIKELQDAIKKTKAEQQKLRNTISKSTEKLSKTQADFQATYSLIAGEIQTDIESMKEYLK
ncbi:PH domain-containing protein [Neolewinella agarilytica]|uniref:hypothetical protein n=1 Tax=Neolewinella agarilytica TaxID=478744 RepID=UPI000B7E0BCB|nr:hypothetical protein [Neolewinella agarilytica]